MLPPAPWCSFADAEGAGRHLIRIRLAQYAATLVLVLVQTYLDKPEAFSTILINAAASLVATQLIGLAVADLRKGFERRVDPQREVIRKNAELSRTQPSTQSTGTRRLAGVILASLVIYCS